ncbi:MAG: hypothetical protein ACTSV3_03535 [Candidatus Thorarchaeota archaeon]|nr:MAG: hypothetical protein DRP09_03635 [Candidatus Thorarchaeota archaeon]RLI59366.1 MAG: hypothetical protein DRO87_03185 [Candidatus Thorarchaeota archaeon]
MSEENSRSDDYWMGVRDALRMVDSFLKWSLRNPERAKSLEDFVHDGLIAAAKRCESCLSEKLGVKFDRSDEETQTEMTPADEASEVASSDLESKPVDLAEAGTEALSEPAPEDAAPFDTPEEVSEPEEDEGLTLDSVERIENEDIGPVDVEGPPRDFTSDFELVEPSPMGVEETAPPTEELEDRVEEPAEDQESPAETGEEEKPSFTWSDYEKAVTPSEEETEPSESEESDGAPDSLAAEPPKIWNPYDEPSIPEEEIARITAEEEPSLDEDDEKTSVSEPPPPPPPPESDEDEEERRRRARRLFFGA